MYLLPFTRISFYSPLSPDAVALLLIRAIPPERSRPSRIINDMEEYFGSIWESSFIIIRNLNYRNNFYPLITVRNPFVPLLKGKIVPDKDGAEIIVSASFPLSILFVSVLFYFVLLLPQFSFISSVINGRELEWRLVTYIFLPLTFYFVQMIFFNSEIKNFKQFLNKVVKAVPT